MNKGQKFMGTFDMYNNEYMSYDVTVKMWLPGTDVSRENIRCSLIDTNTESAFSCMSNSAASV